MADADAEAAHLAAPTNEDPDAAEHVGTMQVEVQRPPPPLFGLAPFAGWSHDAAFAAAVTDGQQQTAAGATQQSAAALKKLGDAVNGWQDPQFKVLVESKKGQIEPSMKVVYISGAPPQGASASSKVDTWSRMKSMRLEGDGDAGSLMHLRPEHIDDGWLLGALAMLYRDGVDGELIKRLHTAEPALGVHAVRLFKDGESKGFMPEWTTVVIDDQLPCHGKKKPIFSTNVDPGGGPVGAVSKALAKLYGCYEQLNGGRVGSALEDLTGGVSDKLYLRDGIVNVDGNEKQPQIVCENEIVGGVEGTTWQRLHEIHSAGHLLGAAYKPKYKACTVGSGPAGEAPAMVFKGPETLKRCLVYPICDMQVVDGKGYLRLKNCYGKIGASPAPEFEGEWGPRSSSWQNEPSVAQALGGKPRDNTFWMTFETFLSGFNKVYICYLPHAPDATIVTVEGEWTKETAGGRLSAAPGAKWRSNPQFRLTVPQKCTVLIAIAQQDAQTDADDASDAYPHAVGFHLIGGPDLGERRTLSYSDGPLRSSRYANSRQVCRLLEVEPSGPDCVYSLMPATWDPNVYMPFTLTVCASAPVTLEPIPAANDYMVATAMGQWSVAGNTSGGCPNFPDTWTNNPQIRLSTSVGGPIGVGVLSLSLPEAELKKLQAKHEQLEAADDVASMLSIGLVVLPIADEKTGRGAGDKPALQKRLTSVALSGTVPVADDQIVVSSSFVHGAEEQATVLLNLPEGPGNYLLVPCTFYPGQECAFTLTIYHSDPKLALTPLKGSRLPPPKEPAAGVGKKVPGVAKNKMAPPMSKHDVSQVRAKGDDGPKAQEAKKAAQKATQAASLKDANAGAAGGGGEALGMDDGEMGYAQKMELELEAQMKKSPENIPVVTIEGAPLSENTKKWKNDCIAKARNYVKKHGGKFEDSGTGGFPEATGRATGEHQPACYESGYRSGTLPAVVEWARPEELAPDSPMFFRNDYDVDNIIPGMGFDNRWFISALNIVSSNRDTLQRVFFDAQDEEWDEMVRDGFFVLKFYQDDPLSDDDWQVVLIDDRIPCTRDADGKLYPSFCRNPDPNVYWAMIVEKAYAKMTGSYEQMQGGTVTQGLEDFTGGIGYKFDLAKREKEWIPPKGSDPDRLWDEIQEKINTNHVIGCANNSKGEERPQSTKKGIVLNRAYALVTAGEIDEIRLMRMRLPYSEDGTVREWNGRWSDNAPQWNNRLRQLMQYSNEDDGKFYIEYKDFCRHFNKVYMCRMLDDLWTRITVKSRWMDETAGGCTNFISWRNNNQWLIRVDKAPLKLVIKLSQPDARKSSGNGRHYSNAIGFYILKGNSLESGDQRRRKLICKDGDADDYICEACPKNNGEDYVMEGPSTAGIKCPCDKCGREVESGDFVFTKEPRFSKQVLAEYTFETASTTPYVLMPYLFEPGREQLFRFSILSDDRDDDGIPDFGFEWVAPEQDWKRITLLDAFHVGGKGNALAKKHNLPFQGMKPTSGGPLEVGTWAQNVQFQLTLFSRTRVFLFLEARNVKTDMRDVEGLQTEPDYPEMGFYVCKSMGPNVLLGPDEKPQVVYTAAPKKCDGVYLELGFLEAEQYVVIPFCTTAGVEHEYALYCYTNIECDLVKMDPSKNLKGCYTCSDPKTIMKVGKKLKDLEKKYAEIMRLETLLKANNRFGVPKPPMSLPQAGVAPQQAPPAAAAANAAAMRPPMPPTMVAAGGGAGEDAIDRMFKAADMDGDGYVSMEEMETFKRYYQYVDKDGDGNVSTAELKRAANSMQQRTVEQHQAFEARQYELQQELHEGNEAIQALMAEVMSRRANAPPVAVSDAQGRAKKSGRSKKAK